MLIVKYRREQSSTGVGDSVAVHSDMGLHIQDNTQKDRFFCGAMEMTRQRHSLFGIMLDILECFLMQAANQTQTESSPSTPNTVSPVPLNNSTGAPRFGTVTPNRIFVGGIDFKTNENDLRKFFAQYGCVREVKIVNDRAGISKGYGFITFETQEDAQKILQEAKKLSYKDKKLNIGPAVRKQQIRIPRSTVIPESGTMYLTTSSGYPYIYHNGVAYFHTPEVASVPQPWPSRSVSSSPMMVAQPVYQPPTYHYQAPTQCLPGQWQWSVPQSPASSPSFFYAHPSEVIYQPVGIAQEGGCVPPPFLLVEAAVPEPYSDHGVQAPHHQPYAQSAIAMPAPTLWSIHY
ncbi:protein boule-like isoform X3 [Anas acuta]|uniref:protein boule-like isoform X3 n=1 Tax=Anas acuta TaxID=28680 RepID=UPI0035C914E2